MPAFLFDMDGTMVDSMPWHARSWELLGREVGAPPPDADFFHRTSGMTGLEVMRLYVPGRSEGELHALVARKEAIYRALFAPVFSEVQGFMAFARRARAAGARLACATAGGPDNIAFVHGHLACDGLFDAVVGAHDVARGKPHPDLFLLAAERLGVAPAHCLVFEDAPHGIEAARRAGMRAVALATTVPANELGAPAHVVARAADFTTLDADALVALAAAPGAGIPAR
ncbi:MAG: HAD-IA family hydrolase [Burkholderiales bacterium]